VAAEFYRRQQQLSRRVASTVEEMWQLDAADLTGSYRRIAGRVAAVVAAGRLVAAAAAEPYVAAAVTEQDLPRASTGAVAPVAVARTASSGRTLLDTFAVTVIHAKARIGRGTPVEAVLRSTQIEATQLAATQVADAGRTSTAVGIAARPQVQGWVRRLQGPSCPRCTSLASRWYRWDAGFRRHPSCDCIGMPCQREAAPDLTVDARGDVDESEGTATLAMVGARAGGVTVPEQVIAAAPSRDACIAELRRLGYLI
jgi:hypothetical protein